MAGRDDVVREFHRVILQRTAGTGGQGPWLSGPRGVGKTVLLSQARALAADAGWLTSYCEITSDEVTDAIGQALRRAQDPAGPPRGAKRAMAALARAAQSMSVSVADPATGVQVQITNPHSPAPPEEPVDLVDVLIRLGRDLATQHRGLLIALDEIHQLPEDGLKVLLAIQQAANVDALPVVILGAGLPVLAGSIAPLTYGDRQEVIELDRLLDSHVEAALAIPATVLGVSISPEAMGLLVGSAQGYPYRVQLLGQHTWDAAAEGDATQIQIWHAEAGIARTEQTLAKNLYRRQWLRLSKARRMQSYLLAMARAQLGQEPVSTAAITRTLGGRTSSYTQARHELLESGFIAVAGPGLLSFADPGFAAFLRAQVDTGR